MSFGAEVGDDINSRSRHSRKLKWIQSKQCGPLLLGARKPSQILLGLLCEAVGSPYSIASCIGRSLAGQEHGNPLSFVQRCDLRTDRGGRDGSPEILEVDS